MNPSAVCVSPVSFYQKINREALTMRLCFAALMCVGLLVYHKDQLIDTLCEFTDMHGLGSVMS